MQKIISHKGLGNISEYKVWKSFRPNLFEPHRHSRNIGFHIVLFLCAYLYVLCVYVVQRTVELFYYYRLSKPFTRITGSRFTFILLNPVSYISLGALLLLTTGCKKFLEQP